MSCEHDFKHIETLYRYEYRPYGDSLYMRTDRFFCTMCLEQRDVEKKEMSREIPSWYKKEVR